MKRSIESKLTNDRSEYRIFTGTAERIIKWNKAYDNFCYYEVISSVISIKEGSIRLQKVMLLRDKKGPILQVVHYVNDHINIDDFHVGQMLRCVGRMVGPNTLHAVSIRAATSDELANLARLCYICDHAVAKTIHSLKGGSAVDAAVAALFCEGVAMPQSTGLGGGFFMTIYKKSTNIIRTLNAREVAPGAAYEDMYGGNASLAAKGRKEQLILQIGISNLDRTNTQINMFIGGLAVAVPGELLGYWEAHQDFGLLPWADLVQPTIDLCRKGHLVTPYLATMFKARQQTLLDSPSLRSLRKREKLADTLEIIAKEGARALYNGSLTEIFVKDIQDFGGIITVEDMNKYNVEWLDPIKVDLPFNQTLYTFPLPGSGAIVTFIINILKGFVDYGQGESITNLQRMVESFKYGYGKRTELGDRKFVPGIDDLISNITSEDYAFAIRNGISDHATYNNPEHYGANTTLVEDHGTAHISILAPNGDAVSVTGTINLYFGAGIRSVNTGIILNDEMDDFGAPGISNSFGMPPSIANYIAPYKTPLSSMCPTIVVNDDGTVRMIAIRHLWYNLTLEEAMERKRFHHQLFPMSIEFENAYDMDIVEALANIGHNYTIAGATDGFAAVTTIINNDGQIEASSDLRRPGAVAYIY
ncbi:gamma glutamyl transpeptidase [Holotrichia oblita]|uniref:Gamma glutamyl transpeptidase n=1 Tax=Holotrichia oblita TaxID=644536 RepID=A0ACB9SN66_HOLOL|nr:gamma glutamyl transpeptidase [Holotrichia oblita]